MPIVIDKELPSYKIFTGERIFVTDKKRAIAQGIRPIEIAILNLTPAEENTEMHIMRLLSNSPLPVNITFLKVSSTAPKTDGAGSFYKSFEEVRFKRFDGMIVTGAPVENTTFERISYWKEFTKILEWTISNVTSTMFICWGAQAALHYFYNIKKHTLKNKCFGIFTHNRIRDGVTEPITRGISDEFHMPHSSRTIVYAKDILHIDDLKVLAYSKKVGASIIKSVDNKHIYVMGHMEYDRYTLRDEYERDKENGLDMKPPANYFADGDMHEVKMNWTSTAHLFYMNWLNYYVYQVTPFNIAKV